MKSIALSVMEYGNYIGEHRDNIKLAYDKYAGYILNELDLPDEVYESVDHQLQDVIRNHDMSKYDIEEFEPYRKKFFLSDYEEYTEEDEKLFQRAWQHHVDRNPHHPEYYADSESGIDMEYVYIIEMVLDWVATSMKFGGTAYTWYEENKERFHFSTITELIVERCLHIIKRWDRSCKTIVIINGVGGSGKDEFIKQISGEFKVTNISTIDEIKKVAIVLGWDGGKSDKDRKFLSDLKKLSSEYNSFIIDKVAHEAEKFMSYRDEVMFIHCREPEEIDKLQEALCECRIIKDNCTIVTMIVDRKIDKAFGNSSDDGVYDYRYDYWFENASDSLDVLKHDAIAAMSNIMMNIFITKNNIIKPIEP